MYPLWVIFRIHMSAGGRFSFHFFFVFCLTVWSSVVICVSVRGFLLLQLSFILKVLVNLHTLPSALTRPIQHLCLCVLEMNIKNSHIAWECSLESSQSQSNSSVCRGTSWGHKRSSHRAHLLCLPDLPLCCEYLLPVTWQGKTTLF